MPVPGVRRVHDRRGRAGPELCVRARARGRDVKLLSELNPLFVFHGGPGVTHEGLPVPRTDGVGLMCDCPCGAEHLLYVPFANPIGPGPLTVQDGWRRTGETFETLTLSPSIHRVKERGGCGWHGFITTGEVRSV
jgi:hypothetical protein